jgi:WD40 repeat protein
MHGNRVEFYDAFTLEPVSQPGLELTKRYRFAFSPDMRLLVTTDTDGNLEAYDLPSQRSVTNFAAHPIRDYEAVLAFTARGTSLLALCKEQIVREWDTATWKEIRRWQADPKTVASAFCPSAGLFATVTENGAVELVKTHQPERRWRFTCPKFIGVTELRLSFSADGKTLAVVNGHGVVELWNTETLTRTAVLRATQLRCSSVSFSADGLRVVASGAGREAIQMWDLNSLEEMARFPAAQFFDDVRFSPDGNTLAARSGAGVIHFWSAPSWQQIEATDRARLGHE